jgi:hypothetical protein
MAKPTSTTKPCLRLAWASTCTLAETGFAEMSNTLSVVLDATSTSPMALAPSSLISLFCSSSSCSTDPGVPSARAKATAPRLPIALSCKVRIVSEPGFWHKASPRAWAASSPRIPLPPSRSDLSDLVLATARARAMPSLLEQAFSCRSRIDSVWLVMSAAPKSAQLLPSRLPARSRCSNVLFPAKASAKALPARGPSSL